MEATKALALRLRHRASLRRANKKNGQAAAQAAAQDYQAMPRRESDKEKRSEDSANIPATVPIPDPPATASAHSTASPTSEGAPLTPSPGSDVSPTSQPPPKHAATGTDPENGPTESPTADYFNLETSAAGAAPDAAPDAVPDAPPGKITFDIPTKEDGVDEQERPGSQELATAVSSASPSTVVSPRGSVDDGATDAGRSSIVSVSGGGSRHSSMNSPVALLLPNGTLPQGRTRTSVNSRHRDSSPYMTSRFRKHVTFTNVHLGEPTKFNFPCYTLIVRHLGYASKRRSRTFMVGIDDHQYSDEALQWLFDKFVDDGDEIVCVRVVEKDVRVFEADKRWEEFQREANAEVEKLKAKCGDAKAISIVLEYAVGKLHSTFQRLIQLHQPSMLIVGTRGRTLGGFQGLVASRNSFSKYCLQYSPVPVVVVRPDEKRQKKKEKRDNDPEKRSYRQMLQSSQGIHEADSDNVNMWETESKLTADEEAGKVARALGLPAKFDPTLKPFKPERQRSSLSTAMSLGPESEPGPLVADSGMTPTVSAANSEDEAEPSGEEEDEAEFEVTSGAKLLQSQKKELKAQLEEQQKEQEKKERLHAMELGEGAALRKTMKTRTNKLESDSDGEKDEGGQEEDEDEDEDEDEEEEEDEDDEDGGGAVKTSSAE